MKLRIALILLFLFSVFFLSGCNELEDEEDGNASLVVVSILEGMEGGRVEPETNLYWDKENEYSVEHGTKPRFRITPDEGYMIGAVNGCGGGLKDGIFTTGTISWPCTIEVEFIPKPLVRYCFDDPDNPGAVCPETPRSVQGSSGDLSLTSYGNPKVVEAAVGKALFLDGKGSYLEGTGVVFPTENTPRTVCLWVRAFTTGALPSPGVVFAWSDPWDEETLNAYGIMQASSPGSASSTWFTHVDTQAPQESLGSGEKASGSWQQVCSSYDGKKVSHYVDGKAAGSKEFGTSLKTRSEAFRIGNLVSSLGKDAFFHGYVDEIRVYSNALTPKNIEFLHFHDAASLKPMQTRYVVSAKAEAGGSLTPLSQEVAHGSTAILTVSADAGFVIDSVTGCGGTLSGTSFTTGRITQACEVTARFKAVPGTFVVGTEAGTGGTLAPTSRAVPQGQRTSFEIVPATGFSIGSVSGCGGTLSGNTFTTGPVTAACTVRAGFIRKSYALTATAESAGGTVTPSSLGVHHGARGNFTVTPDTGFSIASVTGCGGSLSGSTYTTAPVTGACSVTASFTRNSYTVNATGGSGGSITPALQSVGHGLTASFTVQPDAGYSVDSVSGCGGTLSGNTFTTGPVTGACTVSASFTLQPYTVTASAGSGGRIDPPTRFVSHGNTTSFTVTPDTGHSIASVTGCAGTLSGSTYTTGYIAGACTVQAAFSVNTYTLSFDSAGGSAVSPISQAYGSMVTAPAVPTREGYTFTGWSPGVPTTMPAENRTLTAQWTLNTYSVTPAAGTGGSISPATAQTVNHGATTSFTLTPDAGHTASVGGTCGGNLIGTTYTTAPVTGACTVNVTFTPVSCGIVEGRVTDAVTGNGIDGATLTLRGNGWELNASSTGGDYEFPNVCTGIYDLTIQRDGYTDSEARDMVFADFPMTRNIPLSPVITETGMYRMVLGWGAEPQDLDAYLTTPDGNSVSHANTGSQNSPPYASLDQEGHSGYGPETITIHQTQPGIYRYIVFKNPADTTSYAASGARVRLYDASGLLRTWTPPTEPHEWWHVFDLNAETGDIVDKNIILPTRTVTAVVEGTGGSITPASSPVIQGFTAAFTLLPDSGYQVESVSGCGGDFALGSLIYQTGPVHTDCTVTARFALNPDTFQVSANAGSGGSISPLSRAVANGETTSFTVTADTGYGIGMVTGCGGSLSGTTYTTGPITGACTVDATFTIHTYTLSFDSAGGSAVAPITQAYGSAVTAPTAPTREGYTFNGWSPEVPATMPLNGATLTAQWTLNTYTVTPTAGTGGSISPATAQTVTHGNTTTFTITPDAGYNMGTVTGCGGTLNGTTYTTGPITGSCSIQVNFRPSLEVSAHAGNTWILVSWNEIPGATSYMVYYGRQPNIQPDTPASYEGADLGTVSPYQISGLTNDALYYIVIRPSFSGTPGIPSCEVTALPHTVPVLSRPINDTGISTFGDNSSNSLTRPAQGYPGQDAAFGRDVEAKAGVLTKNGAGVVGFDFTKLGTDGLPLSIQNGTWSDSGTEAAGTKWSCVKDNHTGLVWEVKVNDINDLRHRDHFYTWYNPDSSTNGGDAGTQNGGTCTGSGCDTLAFVQAVNAAGLCGATDWRMPTIEELTSIAHRGRTTAPSIDTDFFPNTQFNWFWSSSPYANNGSEAWGLHFYYGDVGGPIKSGASQVRLVRGEQ